eukprot:9197812-Pyramimonas_sp.AAC.1
MDLMMDIVVLLNMGKTSASWLQKTNPRFALKLFWKKFGYDLVFSGERLGHAIGPHSGNMPHSLTRLARTVGICPIPSHDWPALWEYADCFLRHGHGSPYLDLLPQHSDPPLIVRGRREERAGDETSNPQ